MITILQQQKQIMAYANDNYVYVTSTLVNLPRFRFRFELTVNSTTVSVTVPPNAQAVGRLELNNLIKDHFTQPTEVDQNAQEDWVTYSYKIYEQYVATWTADEFLNAPAAFGWPDNFIALTTDGFTNTEHSYSLNDVLEINSPDQAYVKSGIYRIVGIPDSKTIIINQPWLQSAPAINVVTKYSDERVTVDVSSEIGPVEGKVWRGRLNFNELDFDPDNLIINATDGRLITDVDRDFDSPGELFSLPVATYFASPVVGENLELQYIINGTPSQVPLADFLTVGWGPANLGLSVGDEVSVRVENTLTNSVSQVLNYVVVENDCTKFTPHLLVWKDRLGGWKSMWFTLHSTKELTVNKNVFDRKQIPEFDGMTAQYATTKAGAVVSNTKRDEVYTIRRDRMSQFEINLVEDLFFSKTVYIYDGVFVPVILEDNQYQVEDLLHARRKTLTVSYKLSNKNI